MPPLNLSQLAKCLLKEIGNGSFLVQLLPSLWETHSMNTTGLSHQAAHSRTTISTRHRSITSVIALAGLMLLIVLAIPAAGQNPPISEFDVPSNLDIHYIDRDDAGDDPWKPGCHWHFGTKECSAPEFFFMGDSCSDDGRTLYEWTDNTCHAPKNDIRRYNCERLCQDKYGTSGRCVIAPKACRARRANNPNGTSIDSASCVCKKEEALNELTLEVQELEEEPPAETARTDR